MERIKKMERRKTGVLIEVFWVVPVDDPLLMQIMQSINKTSPRCVPDISPYHLGLVPPQRLQMISEGPVGKGYKYVD